MSELVSPLGKWMCTRFFNWRHPGAWWPAVPILYWWVQLSSSSGMEGKVDDTPTRRMCVSMLISVSVLLKAQTATER